MHRLLWRNCTYIHTQIGNIHPPRPNIWQYPPLTQHSQLMVVRIRLARFGRRHAPVYNIVVAQARYLLLPILLYQTAETKAGAQPRASPWRSLVNSSCLATQGGDSKALDIFGEQAISNTNLKERTIQSLRHPQKAPSPNRPTTLRQEASRKAHNRRYRGSTRIYSWISHGRNTGWGWARSPAIQCGGC